MVSVLQSYEICRRRKVCFFEFLCFLCSFEILRFLPNLLIAICSDDWRDARLIVVVFVVCCDFELKTD